MGRLLTRYRGEQIKATGDGVLAVFDGPARAVRWARATSTAVRELGLRIGAGVHAGEVERRGDDIGGLAVHIAARVADLARDGEVLVSRIVTDIVTGVGIPFSARGTHALKGVPGRWTCAPPHEPQHSCDRPGRVEPQRPTWRCPVA